MSSMILVNERSYSCPVEEVRDPVIGTFCWKLWTGRVEGQKLALEVWQRHPEDPESRMVVTFLCSGADKIWFPDLSVESQRVALSQLHPGVEVDSTEELGAVLIGRGTVQDARDHLEVRTKEVMKIWSRIYDAHAAQRGVRLSYEELFLLHTTDGFVIHRMGQVEEIREEISDKQLEELGSRYLALPGLQDKLYWREGGNGIWHCMKKDEVGTFTSLCGRFSRDLSGGQAIDRPDPWQRCGICDGKEMARRGWSESGPTRRTRG